MLILLLLKDLSVACSKIYKYQQTTIALTTTLRLAFDISLQYNTVIYDVILVLYCDMHYNITSIMFTTKYIVYSMSNSYLLVSITLHCSHKQTPF